MAATISPHLAQVKSQLDQYLSGEQIHQLCKELGHTWRKRLLDPAATVHLFVLQLLCQVAMTGLRHASKVQVSAQAICKAKKRLPLTLLKRLVQCTGVTQSTDGAGDGKCGWKGHAVVLADAMSSMTSDTPELAEHFGKAKNHKGKSRSFPIPKLLAALDLHAGLICKIIDLPAHRQERICLTRLFSGLQAGTILLLDRAFAGLGQLALIQEASLHGLLRLPRWQVVRGRGKGVHRRISRLGKQDLLVSWNRHGVRRVSWMSKRRWEALPEALVLRQIAFRIVRQGYRTHWAWVLTTLTDSKRYPAEELVELYGKRWQVEVRFRELKSELGLKSLAARTLEGVRKEILALVLLYNLLRHVMLQVAARQKVAADRISFVDTLTWLRWSGPGESLPELKINPDRSGRASHPRMLKHARKRYTQLNVPREQLLKPAHQVML